MIGNRLHNSRLAVELSLDRGHRAFILVLTFVLLSIGGWIWLGEIDEWTRGTAVLRPSATISIVRNPRDGIVAEQPARHGESVTQGQILWRLDTIELEVEKTEILSRLTVAQTEAAEVGAFLGALGVAVTTESEAFAAGQQDASIVNSMIAAFELEEERLRIQADDADLTLQRNKLVGPDGIAAVSLQQLETEARLARLEYAGYRHSRILDRVGRLRLILDRIASLDAQAGAIASQIEQSVVRAPAVGVVEYSRRFQTGDYLLAGEEVARVSPPGAEQFRVEISVPERQFRRIRVGQTVRIRLNALTAGDFPLVEGAINYVPADGHIGPNGERVFVVEARLSQSAVQSFVGHIEPLRPGMSGRARIIVGRSRIWRLIVRELSRDGV